VTAAIDKNLYKKYRKEHLILGEDEVKKLNRPFTAWGKILALLFFLVYLFVIWEFTTRGGQWYLFGGLMFFYLVAVKGLAFLYAPSKRELSKDYKVTALITSFNEKPESVVGILENLLALDYPVHEVLLLDDGSDESTSFEAAQSFAAAHTDKASTKFQILRFEENRGKLAVLHEGFQRATGDHVFLVDSDCEIAPNALTELLRPFEDGKTTSVVGNIGILNKRENFLTRLQSLKYFGAFQMGRAAQSVTGNVIICSGAFSVHKLDFIRDNIDEIRPMHFMGIKVSAGDDRTLTALSRLKGGKTRYQNTAYCETEVPTTWSSLLKQRRRWMRSTYIGSLVHAKQLAFKRPLYALWTLAEAYLWLVTTVLFVILVLSRGFLYFDLRDIILYFFAVAAIHNGFFKLYNPLKFLAVPAFMFVHGVFLAFVRAYTAITITNDDWGTRTPKQDEEERLVHKDAAKQLPEQALLPRLS
jgi:hyaluronan synthase